MMAGRGFGPGEYYVDVCLFLVAMRELYAMYAYPC